MPKTALFADAQQFARSVAACGGTVPDSLGYLLSAQDVLIAPGQTVDPSAAIVDAALAGELTAAKLQKLLPAAAKAHSENEYRAGLAANTERILLAQFHRELEAGAATEIILSLRPTYDRHAAEIAKARSLFTSESSPEFILASGDRGTLEAWQGLEAHVRVVTKIAAVVSEFGSRPSARFPLVREFALGDTFKLDNRALMATAGGLVADSAEFNRITGDFHKNSAFFRVGGLKLHTIAEAQARHDEWASHEWTRINADRGRAGRILEDGTWVGDKVPPNPYRESANA